MLGILGLKDSLAGRLLIARGARADAIREKIAISSGAVVRSAQPPEVALRTLDSFLAALKGDGPELLAAFFDERGQFVDSSGKRWTGREEIDKGAETLFTPFAKRNAGFFLENTTNGPSGTVLASVLWEFATGDTKSVLRMSIVLASSGEEYAIVVVQVTPVLW